MPLTSMERVFILPSCVPQLHNVVQRARDQLMLMGGWPLHRCHPACVRSQRQENQGAIWTGEGEKKKSYSQPMATVTGPFKMHAKFSQQHTSVFEVSVPIILQLLPQKSKWTKSRTSSGKRNLKKCISLNSLCKHSWKKRKNAFIINK